MNFMQLLNSLDELLYGVMSWLVFYPLTLWRTLCGPLAMMRYAEHELGDEVDDRFADAIAPPLFLLISVLLSHGIELVLIGESSILKSHHGLAALVNDDSSLMILRLLIFGVFPLVLATRMVRLRKLALSHQTLKAPFYSQCYVAAPFALLWGLAATFAQCHWWWWAGPVAVALVITAFAWYVSVQTLWFAKDVGISVGRALWNALLAIAVSILVLTVLLPWLA